MAIKDFGYDDDLYDDNFQQLLKQRTMYLL